MPLEGLFWVDDMTRFSPDDKAAWKWTTMIMQPEMVNADLIAEAVDQAGKKKDLPALPLLRPDTLAEGRAAQIMHLGPYSEEAPTIARLHAFIAGEGLEHRGRHHDTKPE